MDKDTAWSIFESTGNIDAYMLYHDLTYDDDFNEIQGDFSNADQNRRPDYQGFKRR